jgi:hypothetical protein
MPTMPVAASAFQGIRDTPLTIKEAVGPSAAPEAAAVEGDEQVNVRKAIFGV